MSKEEMLEMSGMVREVLPDSRYRVTLDNGHELVAYTAGKMRMHHIRILAGDKVTLELSPYDMTKGRISAERRESKFLLGGHGAAWPASQRLARNTGELLAFRCLLLNSRRQ